MIRVDDSAWLAWGSALWYGTAVQLWTAHALAMLMRSYLDSEKTAAPPAPKKFFSLIRAPVRVCPHRGADGVRGCVRALSRPWRLL